MVMQLRLVVLFIVAVAAAGFVGLVNNGAFNRVSGFGDINSGRLSFFCRKYWRYREMTGNRTNDVLVDICAENCQVVVVVGRLPDDSSRSVNFNYWLSSLFELFSSHQTHGGNGHHVLSLCQESRTSLSNKHEHLKY